MTTKLGGGNYRTTGHEDRSSPRSGLGGAERDCWVPKGVEVRVADDETARRSMLKGSIGLQPGRLCGRLPRRFSSLPAAPKGSRRASFEAIPSSSCRVAIVYGTFASETSAEDAEIMQDYAMRNKLDLLMQVASGDEFDFDSLASCSHLVLSTSSWRGQPPEP